LSDIRNELFIKDDINTVKTKKKKNNTIVFKVMLKV
jgi:hypothetical protein